MQDSLSNRAGSAVSWKTFQYAGVKVILVVRLVVLARLLTPDDFGLMAISLVAIEFTTRITEFGLSPAIVQRPSVDRSHFDSAWTIGLLRAMAVTAIVFLAAPVIAGFFNDVRATPLIQVLALKPFLESLCSIKVANLFRELRFRSVAIIRVPEALTNAIVSIVLAPTLGVWALVVGTIAAPVTAVALSYVVAPYRPRLVLDRSAARSLISFGRWIFALSLIAAAGSAVFKLIITRQLGTADLGVYFLAARLAFLPGEFASKVVGEVMFPLYSRVQNESERVIQIFRSTLSGLTTLLIPVVVLLAVLTPAIVENLLGAKWVDAIPIIILLLPVVAAGLLGDAAIPIFNGLGRPEKVVVVEGLQTLMQVLLTLLLVPTIGLAGAALATLAATLLSQILSIRFLRSMLGNPLRGTGTGLAVVGGLACAGGITAHLVYLSLPTLVGLLAAALGGLVVVLFGTRYADDRFELGLVDAAAGMVPWVRRLIPR